MKKKRGKGKGQGKGKGKKKGTSQSCANEKILSTSGVGM